MSTARSAVFVLFIALVGVTPGRAVDTGSDLNKIAPTGSDISNWDNGWAQPVGEPDGMSVTGWNYVGQVGDTSGASATYLGNGWVLTAGHVGAGNFVLDGQTYDLIGSGQNIDGGTVDLTLFQISMTSTDGVVLNLPALTLSTTDPTAFAYGTTGSSVVMIGYGRSDGSRAESWGLNTVTQINQPITPDGTSYLSNDFLTLTGTTTYNNPGGPGSQSINNPAQLVGGDSGGGDFIYNAATGKWELAGINEVMGTTDSDPPQDLSGFVQLDTYASEISGIDGIPLTATPEPPLWLLLGLGVVSVAAITRSRRPLR